MRQLYFPGALDPNKKAFISSPRRHGVAGVTEGEKVSLLSGKTATLVKITSVTRVYNVDVLGQQHPAALEESLPGLSHEQAMKLLRGKFRGEILWVTFERL